MRSIFFNKNYWEQNLGENPQCGGGSSASGPANNAHTVPSKQKPRNEGGKEPPDQRNNPLYSFETLGYNHGDNDGGPGGGRGD